MTLFTAEGLVRSVGDGKACDDGIVAAIREAYLAWNDTQMRVRPDGARYDDLRAFSALWARRHPGTTCLSAMAAGGRGTVGSPINDSKGCGGVMRTAPIGLVRGVTADRAFSLASRAAALTHGHPSGYLSAGALASMICDLVSGVDLPESLEGMRARIRRQPSHEETLSALDNAVADAKSPGVSDVVPADLGGGWVGEEALAIAVYAVLTAVDFRDLLRIASNHDGDSDSTASIAGQIWGAQHGVSAMPVTWISRLDLLDPLCEAAKCLLALDPR
jgi:ADP-ribosylglycohydrolase